MFFSCFTVSLFACFCVQSLCLLTYVTYSSCVGRSVHVSDSGEIIWSETCWYAGRGKERERGREGGGVTCIIICVSLLCRRLRLRLVRKVGNQELKVMLEEEQRWQVRLLPFSFSYWSFDTSFSLSLISPLFILSSLSPAAESTVNLDVSSDTSLVSSTSSTLQSSVTATTPSLSSTTQPPPIKVL